MTTTDRTNSSGSTGPAGATEHTLDRPEQTASARVAAIVAGRRARHRRHASATIVLGILVFALFAVALMVGNTFYTPDEVIRVILGETVPGPRSRSATCVCRARCSRSSPVSDSASQA